MTEREKLGLRELKKQRTRETIMRVAMDLFEEQGYEKTTIAQIAEAAEVSPRTISTYFPSKEEIAFDTWAEKVEALGAALSDRAAGETTIDAMRIWLLNESEMRERFDESKMRQRRVIDSDETLRAIERSRYHDFEQLLAKSIARDMDLDPSDLEPRLAASATIAVFGAINEEWFGGEAACEVSGDSPAFSHQMEILDRAFAFVSGGIEAVRPAGVGNASLVRSGQDLSRD